MTSQQDSDGQFVLARSSYNKRAPFDHCTFKFVLKVERERNKREGGGWDCKSICQSGQDGQM